MLFIYFLFLQIGLNRKLVSGVGQNMGFPLVCGQQQLLSFNHLRHYNGSFLDFS